MTRVHVLSPAYPESFWLPLRVHRRRLQDLGLELHFFPDTSDSTGTPQFEVLPLVDLYGKQQLLLDRSAYQRPLYSGRLFCDYYHRELGIEDDEPQPEVMLLPQEEAHKLRVSWSGALRDYGLFSGVWATLRGRLPLPYRYSMRFTPVGRDRPHDLCARFGVKHHRNTVLYQRRRIVELLHSQGQAPTQKVSHLRYFSELRRSKVAISPFGYGEFSFKDYESMISGAALFKPDVDHVDTWPPLYVHGETYWKHPWDLTDFLEQLEAFLHSGRVQEIAETAQQRYRRYVLEPSGHEEFCKRVLSFALPGR
jgi:hypothetical protein